ncbi:cytochrome P450 [Streptomyces sp. NPDC002476]|uniref:cytochrome P450 n=1 Tax=Streptomyces sp. NPDC002476 TaxID=3364648 RepID=UPI0036A51ABC
MKVDLLDPSLFERGEFWPVLAWLRANDPVHRHAEPDGPGFWVVSRYEDIVGVYGDQENFSSRYGMRLDSDAEAVSAVAQRMLIVSDPPDHTHLKRVLGKMFAQAELERIGHLVRRVVHDVLTEAVEAGELDFLDAARKIPNHVVCSLMDIPRADWEWVGDITTEAFEGADEETRQAAHGEIFLYFTELLADRRKNPGTDFVSRVAHDRRATGVTGEERPLTDEEIVFNCNGVLAGANETTRYSSAGGVLALIENPDQWTVLRAGGPAAVPAAVEEVLRWTVPGVHAMRTALRPTTIGGVRIGVGDRVTLWNVSANRDETVFPRADRFDVTRSPNRHISFGAGRHLCLGARLARMELNAFLTGLTALVDRMELLGEPRYNASNFTWGISSLPLRLVP